MACVTRQLYSSQYKQWMDQLWQTLDTFLRGPAFQLMCANLERLAALEATHYFLKRGTLNGAVWMLRGKKRVWNDPGNAVYTVCLVLLKHMCSWIRDRGRYQKPPYTAEEIARAEWFGQLFLRLQQKWPRRNPDEKLELLGDFIAYALACGYNDQKQQWVLVEALSDFVMTASEILTFIQEHGPYSFDLHHIQGPAPSVKENAFAYGMAFFFAVQVHHHEINASHDKWPSYCHLAEQLQLVYTQGHGRPTMGPES